jgi:transcriptional regulator GlxA family with amidase domain
VVGKLGVCRRTMERRFARATGRSILSEITRCRLDRAKRLLLETKLPAHGVASSLGFPSTKTFNRTFMRLEGQTPTAFRYQDESWKSNPDRQRTHGRPA